jgi:hypothetical protein
MTSCEFEYGYRTPGCDEPPVVTIALADRGERCTYYRDMCQDHADWTRFHDPDYYVNLGLGDSAG